MSDLNDIAREILLEHDTFSKACKDSHLAAKDTVWALYTSWRDSEQGKQWKADFLKECGHKCPECDKWLNEFNSTIDHKLSRRKYPWLGWKTSNFWVLCMTCNKAKGHKDWSKYVETVRLKRGEAAYKRVVKYSPC
ncbi:MAG TPA: hypothetical protein V6D10_17655 [Trichocoleus sp.]|jgi:5-methylcytosine-specific restriction endonuclease McrA